MRLIALLMTLVLMSGLPTFGPRNLPPIANDDEVFLMYHPAQSVDIPVLANDVDPEGRVLRVTGLPMVDGGKAEIIDGKSVRVYIDWSQGGGNAYGLVAHGAYFVSDGQAVSKAEWFVWYWPEILP